MRVNTCITFVRLHRERAYTNQHDLVQIVMCYIKQSKRVGQQGRALVSSISTQLTKQLGYREPNSARRHFSHTDI